MTLFQKYLSYVSRIVVEKTSSEFNEQLIVAIQDGKYVLNAKQANFSFASLHRVFRKAFNKAQIQKAKIDNVLVLGCGAGSIPHIIYKELLLSPKMEAIEIDDKVIALGNKYFGLNHYEKLKVINEDALNYINTTTKKYNLICVDIFDGLDVPKQFLEANFLKELNSKLTIGGILLMNFVAYNYETKQGVNKIESDLGKIFTSVETFKVEGINRVFHCIK